MLLLDPLETPITNSDLLRDKATKRNWKVKGAHRRYPNSWIIVSGHTSRIVFPIDQKDYNIVLKN